MYPEITGYYLSWLAFVSAHRADSDLRKAATEAVAWVDSVTSDDCPPRTRYYFDNRHDWRNTATFTFDLAMLCRGLHAVRRLVPEQPRLNVLQRLLRHVLPTGRTLPVFRNARCELPDRWSTRPGPFQLKTAAALLAFQNHPAIWNTFDKWSGKVMSEIEGADGHGALYALEGLVQFGVSHKPHALQEAANCFEALVVRLEQDRSDVLAQALRLGLTLRSLGFCQGNEWNGRLAELHARLEHFILNSGAVCFRPPRDRPINLNTWAAIFTHQAMANRQSQLCSVRKRIP